VVAVVVLAVLAAMARPLLFATVDADVAAARQVPVRALSVAFLVLLGLTAAEVSQITGALLVFALLVMPAAAAQQISARPAVSFLITIVVAVAVTWLSLTVAYYSTYPSASMSPHSDSPSTRQRPAAGPHRMAGHPIGAPRRAPGADRRGLVTLLFAGLNLG